MFERFGAAYRVTAGVVGSAVGGDDILAELRAVYGGCTFEDGLYRVHSLESSAEATSWVREAFPEYGDDLTCFGFDWLGRQYAADASQGGQGDFAVVMLDPNAGEALESLATMSQFHDTELVDFRDEMLAPAYFGQWRAHDPEPLGFHECAGHQVPLFLGGADDLANIKRASLDVHWSFAVQLIAQGRGLAPGTPVTIGVEPSAPARGWLGRLFDRRN